MHHLFHIALQVLGIAGIIVVGCILAYVMAQGPSGYVRGRRRRL